jgi:hypothetical protein
MNKKILTNHPFSKKQLESLQKELNKISDIEIVLKGVQKKSVDSITDIKLLHSPYALDVYLSFTQVVDSAVKFELYAIKTDGTVDYKPRRNMEFKSLDDRIHYFNTLQEINIL